MSNKPNRKPHITTKKKSTSQTKTLWIFGGVVAVVVLIAILAILITKPNLDSGAAYQDVKTTGQDLASFGTGTDPAVGQTIPTIEGQDAAGGPIAIGAGEPAVIMVVAHWCPHCQAEIPRIQDWLNKNGTPTGVRLLAISTAADSTRPNYPAGPWLEAEGWTIPTLVDDRQGTAASALGTTSYPYFVAVNSQGQVVARTSGEIDIETLEALIEAARS